MELKLENIKHIIYLLLLGSLFSCGERDCYHEYEFHFPVAMDTKDTLVAGDTLWIAMSLPNELIDHQTEELVDLSRFDLYFDLSLTQLDTPYQTRGLQDFEIIEGIGNTVNRGYSTLIYPKSIEEKLFYIGLVPRKKGVYLMLLSYPSDYHYAEMAEEKQDRLSVTNSLCTRQNVTRRSKIEVNNGATNFNVLENYPCQFSSPNSSNVICYNDYINNYRVGNYTFVVD